MRLGRRFWSSLSPYQRRRDRRRLPGESLFLVEASSRSRLPYRVGHRAPSMSSPSPQPTTPARLCRSRQRYTLRAHAFLRLPPPRWAFSSLLAPASSRLVPQKSGPVITFPPRSAPLGALLRQVCEQYRDMPGLKLTKPQATRLFGVAPSVCAAMLRALVMENFLSRAGDGVFVRSTAV